MFIFFLVHVHYNYCLEEYPLFILARPESRDQLYDGVSSMLYNPVNKTWSQHWPGVNHLVKENYLDDEARQLTLQSGSLSFILDYRLGKLEPTR